MVEYFPRQTLTWKVEEPPVFRRLTLSLVEMSVLTGILLRVYRAFVHAHAADSWLVAGTTLAFGAVILFGMLAIHLANFPIRHWLWRAPAFAILEAAAEMITSLGLIAIGREPYGTARAEMHDWMAMATNTLLIRVVAIALFALVLAGVVQAVRYALLRRDNRGSTADRIHRQTTGMPLPPDG
ncbi:MAG TPA: hypothetical protein VMM18_16275 [Gemmatimonadaceae bacterium]|nr:hypothetical protein [Gemmatimonadaceae bacterium]